MKIGVTGANGFLGYHLVQSITWLTNNEVVAFNRELFDDSNGLIKFVEECDVIVHLAGLNRHESDEVLYQTNVNITKALVDALTRAKNNPHVILSSSSQESQGNVYGNSKKKARELIDEWAFNGDGLSTGLLIPNVFGPFGKPFYNSVVATFCHQIANDKKPQILNDSEVGLIYVNDLVEEIIRIIDDPNSLKRENGVAKHIISPQKRIFVSKLLDLLSGFKEIYIDNLGFPNLDDEFEKAMFNTFRCYVPVNFYPKLYVKHTDNRGAFVEIARCNTPGQTSYSTTVPGITRGNHFHTRKAERFAVIKGKARIQVRRIGTDQIINYELDGNDPSFVDMPIWHTHNIKNIGEDELVTLFWINEPYDPADPDTYFEEV